MVDFLKRFWLVIVVFLAGESVVVAVLKDTFFPSEEEVVEAEMVDDEPAGPKATVMYGTPFQIVANPVGTGGLRVVIVEFDLYLDDPLTVEEVTLNRGRIHDAVIGLMGSKSIEDLQHRDAVPVLKYQLAEVISGVLTKGVCLDTTIRMLVVQ